SPGRNRAGPDHRRCPARDGSAAHREPTLENNGDLGHRTGAPSFFRVFAKEGGDFSSLQREMRLDVRISPLPDFRRKASAPADRGGIASRTALASPASAMASSKTTK